MGQIIIDLLKTMFFLQGSYVLTYVPIMIIVMTGVLYFYAKIGLISSLLIALQCVCSAYLIAIIVTALIGFALTHFDYPLINHGMKRPLHYHVAVILSCLIYAGLQILLLTAQKNRAGMHLWAIVLICNAITAATIIGLNVLLFVRHL